MNKAITLLILGIFMLSFTSALTIDNIKYGKDTTFDGKQVLGNTLLEKYKPIEIKNTFGLGSTLFEGYLSQHDDSCGIKCKSTMEINLHKDGVLIDNVIFKTLQEDNSWIEQDVRSYQFYINTKGKKIDVNDYELQCEVTGVSKNGTEINNCDNVLVGTHKEDAPEWTRYNIGDTIEKGIHQIKLEANKKSSRTVDWIIETQGKKIESWAVWGNISEGDDAEVILNSPTDNYISTTNEVEFNATATVTSGATLTNMSLWTNESGTWTQYNLTTFGTSSTLDSNGADISLSFGDTSKIGMKILTKDSRNLTKVTINPGSTPATKAYLYSSAMALLASSSFVGDNATFSYLLTDATEYYILIDRESASYDVKYTETFTNPYSGTYINWTKGWDGASDRDSRVYGISSITTNSLSSETTSSIQTLNRTITDTTLWNVQACDSDGDCGFAISNYTLSIDSTAPTITVESPTGVLDYNLDGGSETLNVTFTDTNLESCWYDYNGTNITIDGCSTGVKNSTTITLEDNNYNITLWANDSVGNINSSVAEWSYKMFGGSELYDSNTTEGSIETFSINLTVNAAYQISTAKLYYDSTPYSSTFTRDGTEYYISKSITIPTVTSDENKTFYWSIVLDDATTLNTTSNNQTVYNINIDSCGAYSTSLINMNLVDEETQIAINETTNDPFINVYLNIYTAGSTSPLISYSQNFTDSNTGQVCIDNELMTSSYEMDVKIQYGAIDYRTEQYNIQKLVLDESTLAQNITLYDILVANSESFVINVKDGSFLPLGDAIIDISREYVAEGQFKSVEIPKTDSNGKSVASLSPEDTTYTITVSKNQETLAIFSNQVAICQNELTGECVINLNILSSVETLDDYTTIDNVIYTVTFDYSSKTIELSFNSINGESIAMSMDAVVFDVWSNDTACTDSLTSSSGVLTCVIPDSYSNQTVLLNVYKNEELINSLSFSLKPNPEDYFGKDGYLFAILTIMTLPLMFITSTVGMVVGGILGLVFVSLLLFLNQGGAFGLGLSGIWLIIAGAIIIYKMSSGGNSS